MDGLRNIGQQAKFFLRFEKKTLNCQGFRCSKF